MKKKKLLLVVICFIVCGLSLIYFKSDYQISKRIKNNTNFDELYFDDDKVKELAEKQIGTKQTLNLKNLNNENIDISNFKGKKVIMLFLKTTCPECNKSLKEIEKVENERKDIVFLRYYLKDTSKVIRSKYKEQGISLNEKNTFSGQDNNIDIQPIISKFNLEYVPSFYFINERGFITLLEVGGINEPTLNKYIELAYTKK